MTYINPIIMYERVLAQTLETNEKRIRFVSKVKS